MLSCKFAAYFQNTFFCEHLKAAASVFSPVTFLCCPHIETCQLICRVNQFTGYYMRATLALNGLSNDSRVSKSSEGLMSAFKVFTLHTGHCHSSSFFALKKNMLADNLNKICVHILKLLLAFLISVLLTSSNFTSGGISSDFMR